MLLKRPVTNHIKTFVTLTHALFNQNLLLDCSQHIIKINLVMVTKKWLVILIADPTFLANCCFASHQPIKPWYLQFTDNLKRWDFENLTSQGGNLVLSYTIVEPPNGIYLMVYAAFLVHYMKSTCARKTPSS